jgi:hypothetical protein
MAINYLRSVPGRKEKRKTAAVGGAEVFNGGELKTALWEAGTLLGHLPCAAAFWSPDRRFCVFNALVRQLVGFCEHDLEQTNSLWTDQIHPHDRDSFLTAWNKLQNGAASIFCHYRFFPKHKTGEVLLREFSFPYQPRDKRDGVIWSFYSEDSTPVKAADKEGSEVRQIRELVAGLIHEISNHLQVISGELDLLSLAGALPAESSKAVTFGVQKIHELTCEIDEYLCPPPLQLRSEDLATMLTEVIRGSERELTEHGIRTTVVLKEPIPKLRLDWQFRSALRRIIKFSCALLPRGGELKLEAGLHLAGGNRYVELSLINASPTHLSVDTNDVFRPFLKVNDCRVGLSMAVAREILRRHFGKVVFHTEQRNRGVFSILIKAPDS